MTIYFHSHDLQLYRKRHRSNNRYSISATLTVIQTDIQPMDPQRLQMEGGRFGATYTAFVDQDINIKEGDQAVDTATGKRYSVKGVQSWGGAGLLDHIELILVSIDGTDSN